MQMFMQVRHIACIVASNLYSCPHACMPFVPWIQVMLHSCSALHASVAACVMFMQIRHQAYHMHCCQRPVLFSSCMHAICNLGTSYGVQLHCTACRCRSMRAFDQLITGPQMISHAHLHNLHQQHCQSRDLSRMTRGFAHHVKAYTPSDQELRLQSKASQAYR